MTAERPPKHLRTAGKRLWRDVHAEFEVESNMRPILLAAAEAADRASEAREMVNNEGIVVPGRYGPRAHPGIAVERDARLAMLRALRALGFGIGRRKEELKWE